jgi:hypothetical protein
MRKKYLLLMGLVLTFPVFSENNIIEVKGGYDIYKNIEQKDGNGYDKLKFKNGFGLGAEYRREIFENIQLGAGVEYNFNSDKTPGDKYSSVDNSNIKYSSDDLDSIPLYATARYVFRNRTEFTPYVKVNMGYSFNSGDMKAEKTLYNYNKTFTAYDYSAKDSFYYAFGTGVEYRNFIVDLTYEINNYKADGKRYTSVSDVPGGLNVSYKDEDIKFKNQKLKLSVGYQFNF